MRYSVWVFSVVLMTACVNQQDVRVSTNTPQIPVALSNGLDGDEEQAILSYHNEVRASVNVPPLIWSKTLAQHAATWGATLAVSCSLKHSQDSRYGENLFMVSAIRDHEAVIDAAKSWESERDNYVQQPLSTATAHYTQMVWQENQALGCAKLACNNKFIVICHYAPAGNYQDKKPY